MRLEDIANPQQRKAEVQLSCSRIQALSFPCLLWKHPPQTSHLTQSKIWRPRHVAVPSIIWDPNTPPSLGTSHALISYHFPPAYSAPATLPFFLFLRIAQHIPASKSEAWGTSSTSRDSFPHFLKPLLKTHLSGEAFLGHLATELAHPPHSALFFLRALATWHVIRSLLSVSLHCKYKFLEDGN